MSKHIADKRKPSTGARVKQFLRLSREQAHTTSRAWEPLWRQPTDSTATARRMQEFLRIARGHRS